MCHFVQTRDVAACAMRTAAPGVRFTVIAGIVAATLATGSAQAQPAGDPPSVPEPPPSGDQPPDVIPAPPPPELPAPAPVPLPPEGPPAAPPPVAPAAKPSLSVVYDKGIVFATDDESFETRISLRNQFRFEVKRPTEDGAEASAVFSVPRTRLQLEGNLFGKENRYKLEFALGDKGSFSFVKDLFVDKRLPGQALWVRFGQWKRPFNRQELISDFGSEFNERANTAEFVGGGRDLGIAVHNDYDKSPDGLEWIVGVFNGWSGGSDRPQQTTTCTADAAMTIDCTTGAPTTLPGDFGPAVVGRVGWNHGGIKGYSEADLEGGPLRLAVGVSYKVDLADLDKGDQSSVGKNLSHGAQVDAMLKVDGFGLLVGAYLMKVKSGDAQLAAMLQGGYFLRPKRAQIGARFAFVPTAGSRKQLEARFAFNWYWQGHSWKWATDVGMLLQTGEDPATMAKDDPDFQGRSMVQLTF